jgi:beta-mannosidase
MTLEQFTLTENWSWRLANSHGQPKADAAQAQLSEWTPCRFAPSVIQMELLERKLIENPDVGENERLIQWVGECDWAYSCAFKTPDSVVSTRHADLVFEGLDTIAVVHLNGAEILRSENMFIPHRVAVKGLLKPAGEENEMIITFGSAPKRARELEQKHGQTGPTVMRGRLRNHLRKAQV